MEKAIFEYLSTADHLRGSLRVSGSNSDVRRELTFEFFHVARDLMYDFLRSIRHESLLAIANKTYQALSGHRPLILCHLERNVLNKRCANRIRLLTFKDHAHVVDKTVDNPESLSRGIASLVFCEPVQPLQNRLNVLLSKNFFYKFYCIALSNV